MYGGQRVAVFYLMCSLINSHILSFGVKNYSLQETKKSFLSLKDKLIILVNLTNEYLFGT